LKKCIVNLEQLQFLNQTKYCNETHEICGMYLRVQALQIWWKNLLQFRRYRIFPIGIVFLLAHPYMHWRWTRNCKFTWNRVAHMYTCTKASMIATNPWMQTRRMSLQQLISSRSDCRILLCNSVISAVSCWINAPLWITACRACVVSLCIAAAVLRRSVHRLRCGVGRFLHYSRWAAVCMHVSLCIAAAVLRRSVHRLRCGVGRFLHYSRWAAVCMHVAHL